MHAQLAKGIDPGEARKAQAAARQDARGQTFGVVGLEFLATQVDPTMAESTRAKAHWLFGLLRTLHARPITEIRTVDLVKVLKAVEESGDRRESSHRAAQFAGRVLRYAIQTGRLDTNPAANLRGALKPIATTSHAALTDPDRLAVLLRLVDSYRGHPTVSHALRLLPLTFVRPGELRAAEWSEINLQRAEWIIPVHRMKMRRIHRRAHLVPLSRQSIEILKRQQALTGDGRYVFPGDRNKLRPMSENALTVALNSLRWLMPADEPYTAHGFRATASSLLNGELGVDSALVELQLAHRKRDKIAAVYDRSERVPERRALMQTWADYLDKLKAEVGRDL
jgi:integrase